MSEELKEVKQALESLRIDFELGHTIEPYGLTFSKEQCERQNKAFKESLTTLDNYIARLSSDELEAELTEIIEKFWTFHKERLGLSDVLMMDSYGVAQIAIKIIKGDM